MRIAVLGAGAWGTALACRAADRHDVTLWARDGDQARQMAAQRRNLRYLPGADLPPTLRVTAVREEALAGAELAVVATPMSALREQLRALPSSLPALWLCKGFESGSGCLGHEVAQAERPFALQGVLSGPSFALEVARAQPTALVAASPDASVIDLAQAAFHSDVLRVYRSADPIGVEVGGAVKNVLAIATGILDGLAESASPHDGAPGLNARAALITRGLAEMTRLGVALGAQATTFMGLSGLGDLVLTATGALSRNRQVGLRLAAGLPLSQVLAELGHVAEGVVCARTVWQRGRQMGLDLPITAAVVAVLEGQLGPGDAVSLLMSRQARAE